MKERPSKKACSPAEPKAPEGLDWVWRHWILQLLGGLALLSLVLGTMPAEGNWTRFWYVLLLTGTWLLVGVVNAAVSRGRPRWFVGLVLAMVSPFLILVAASETGRLHQALLLSSLLAMLSIAMCPRSVSIAIFAAGLGTTVAFKAAIGHVGDGVAVGYVLQLGAAYGALAGIALAWRLFLQRMHEALTYQPPPPPEKADAVIQERDRLRDAVVHHIQKLDAMLEQAEAAGRGGSG